MAYFEEITKQLYITIYIHVGLYFVPGSVYSYVWLHRKHVYHTIYYYSVVGERS